MVATSARRRHVLEHHRLGGEERGAQRGQRRVLGRAHRAPHRAAGAALDDEARGHQQPSRRAAPEAQPAKTVAVGTQRPPM